MTYAAPLLQLLDQDAALVSRQRLQVKLADTREEVRAAQRLRYKIFAEEMGARLRGPEPGLDADRFDPYCRHLIVRHTDTGQVVGCYRILTDTDADRAGGYYAQTEFDLTRILPLPGRIAEVGRSCVHPDYRNGGAIALLWGGLARFMVENRIDYVVGCASIPLTNGTNGAYDIYERLARSHLTPPAFRTFPKVPLPKTRAVDTGKASEVPPLIKAYLRAGAQIGGEPAWDPVFNVADLFILLRTETIARRYRRHFLQRA